MAYGGRRSRGGDARRVDWLLRRARASRAAPTRAPRAARAREWGECAYGASFRDTLDLPAGSSGFVRGELASWGAGQHRTAQDHTHTVATGIARAAQLHSMQ
jgi:hypothetical protein